VTVLSSELLALLADTARDFIAEPLEAGFRPAAGS
jgi:hypothetical protein